LSTITLGTGPDARIVSFSYNTAGDLATITDPLGRTAHFEYDAVGRVTQHTFADGRMIRYAYDANGNVIAVTPPGRPPHTYAYTPLNLLSVYTPPHVGASADQTLYTYNADGDLSRITRPDGQIVNFGYDNAGQLTAITLPRGQVTYAYAIVNDWLKDGKGTDREEFARKELLKKFQNPERKEYEDLLKQAEETGEKGVDPIGKKFRELFRKINKALCGGEGEPPPEQQRPSPQKKLPNTKLPPGYNPDPRSQY
jgi:YD repeat-containing protein